MKITTLEIQNIRSFKGHHTFQLSPTVNLFVGKNNAGKSTVLRCLYLLQTSNSDMTYLPTLNRKGEADCGVTIHFDECDSRMDAFDLAFAKGAAEPRITCQVKEMTRNYTGYKPDKKQFSAKQNGSILPKEPYNLLVPFFSRRKAVGFQPNINAETTFGVHEDLRHLHAKISRLRNADDETRDEFEGHCKRILGCLIGLSPTANGSESGIWLSPTEYVPITAMGEGTSNILGMIVELCVANGKTFLIEELENDLHPEALKAVLDLIVAKSGKNQFVISTHSNIVVRHLGSVETTKIFSFRMQFESRLPTTTVVDVENTETARAELLREVGYEPFDLGLWQAYLILEESSAESVLNAILMPYFAPRLQGRLRTISARGIANVEPAYSDFHRLFVFLNKSRIYHRTSWVRVDGDADGKEVVKVLREKFKGIAEDRFASYSQPAFERYYPARFQEEASEALAKKSRDEKRNAKKALCLKVMEWACANPGEAKAEFAVSASELVEDLKVMEKEILNPQG